MWFSFHMRFYQTHTLTISFKLQLSFVKIPESLSHYFKIIEAEKLSHPQQTHHVFPAPKQCENERLGCYLSRQLLTQSTNALPRGFYFPMCENTTSANLLIDYHLHHELLSYW